MSSHKPANVLRNRAVTRENFTLFSVLYCTEMCTKFHSNCSDSSPRCRRADHSIVFATWLQRVPWAHANLPQTSPLVHPFCQAHWCARQRDRPRSRHDVCSSSPHFMLCMRYADTITLTIQGGGLMQFSMRCVISFRHTGISITNSPLQRGPRTAIRSVEL